MTLSVQFDPDVIEEYARGLYARARAVVIWSALVGLVVGTVAAAVLARALVVTAGLAELAIGASIGGMLGVAHGKARAFGLILQAQVALCQLQIEKNTRPDHRSRSSASSSNASRVAGDRAAKGDPL